MNCLPLIAMADVKIAVAFSLVLLNVLESIVSVYNISHPIDRDSVSYELKVKVNK